MNIVAGFRGVDPRSLLEQDIRAEGCCPRPMVWGGVMIRRATQSRAGGLAPGPLGMAASPPVEESVERFWKGARRFEGMFTSGEFRDMLQKTIRINFQFYSGPLPEKERSSDETFSSRMLEPQVHA